MSRAERLKSHRPVSSAGFDPPAAGLSPAKAVESRTEETILMNPNVYLEPSPPRVEGRAKLPPSKTELVAADATSPAAQSLALRRVPSEEIDRPAPPQSASPLQAIRAKCIDCSGGSCAEVEQCTATGCALWPLRLGANPKRRRARS